MSHILKTSDITRIVAESCSLSALENDDELNSYTTHSSAPHSLPHWAKTLKEIIENNLYIRHNHAENLHNIAANQRGSPINPKSPLPFEDALSPILSFAHQRLLNKLGLPLISPDDLPSKLLSDAAYLDLQRSLLQRLVKISEKTLHSEFAQFIPLGYNLLKLIAGDLKSQQHKSYYTSFVEKLLEDGMLSFFQTYPVLGRLMATIVDFWIDFTAEFLQRLESDLARIQQLFCLSTDEKLRQVVNIKTSLSDSHNCGRTVLALTFDSRLKLIYKPRNLDLDLAYNQLLSWINSHSSDIHFISPHNTNSYSCLPFKVLKVLNCQSHGWVEYVDHMPCKDRLSVQRYYQRSGMLLCLVHVLKATDCHHENVIASGEYPVLIDLETLMHHQPPSTPDDELIVDNQSYTFYKFRDSVVRTGFLPTWIFAKTYPISFDLSGLGSVEPQQLPRRSTTWQDINTDDMNVQHELVVKPVQKNVVVLNEVILDPSDYVDDLVVGFKKMYCLLSGQTKSLTADNGPLQRFKGKKSRFILRNTHDYAMIMEYALAPEFFRSGIIRRAELDKVIKKLFVLQDADGIELILREEIKAMEQLDLPYFEVHTDSGDLRVGADDIVVHYFKKPGYEKSVNYLQRLNEQDLSEQVALIFGSFHGRVAQSQQPLPCRPETIMQRGIDGDRPFGGNLIRYAADERFLSSAVAIAQEIQSNAIIEGDGGVHWIGLSHIPNIDRFQLQILDESFYRGNCGIAVFLAALDYITSKSRFRELILGSLQHTCRMLRLDNVEKARRFAGRTGIGGATGLGSIIYSLTKVGRFMEETSLIDDAYRVANLITPDLIAADKELDVIDGAAGAILGLLALYQEVVDSVILDKAVACGQQLIKSRFIVDGSPEARSSFRNEQPVGFSQGAAGVAYALLGLYAETANNVFLDAACKEIAHEHDVFSKFAARWTDLHSSNQQSDQSTSMLTWCNGAAGIGLGRLGSLSVLKTDEIQQDIELALQVMENVELQCLDNLGCGIFGCVEFLLVSAESLSRPQLRRKARQIAASRVDRAERAGGYHLLANVPIEVVNPTFFHGTAGIGYELLRVSYLEALPSVLLWK